MRLRVRYTKNGKIRFTSHRDVARLWERSLRRAHVPMAYSEGFSPRPKLAFGLALSTGYESDAEYIDLALSETIPLDGLVERLTEMLPDGLVATAVAEIDRGTSLQQAITCCRWEIDIITDDLQAASTAVAQAKEAEEIMFTRTRKGKPVTDDLRPYVWALDVLGPTETGCRLAAELGTQPRALRPAELLAALDPAYEAFLVRRTHQWITNDDGDRSEPLLAAPASAVPTPVGAT